MNDEQMQPLLDAWYRDREVAPRDVCVGVARVMANVPRTRQQSRWLPFPVFYRKAQTATATDTTEYQPSLIPASNGHAPTVIGRTQTMFSPVKAIIAGALVFALGGAFLIAQPFDQQGSVPGAEQGADPAAPVEVTGKRVDRVCSVSAGTGSGLGVEGRQMTCEMSHEWSDPRLDGTATYISNEVEYTDDSNLVIGQYVQNIVNDDGAWRMRPQFRFHSAGPGPENFSGTWVLDGEGAYEGLVAVLDKSEGGTLHGFIIEGDVPSAPAEASTK